MEEYILSKSLKKKQSENGPCYFRIIYSIFYIFYNTSV